MRTTTRSWFAASLLLLLGAAGLHTAMLLGASAVWPALVHLTLLGWASGMIVAVNLHTMPVFTGRDFPDERPIWAQLAAFVGGLALVTAGMLVGAVALIVAGLALELLAALLFLVNIALLLRRGVARGVPPPPPPFPAQREVDKVGTRATSLAGVCLPLALALMLAVRVGAVGGGWWLVGEHVVALGWVMLMIVGVAYHVLPRFSGRPIRGAAWARRQLGLHLAGLALIVLGLGLGWNAVFAAGGLVTGVSLGLFAWTVWPTLRAVVATPGPQLITPTLKGKEPAR